ncbi:MAG TPA: diguanylate cyclase [Acidimicrobiales bacterium]
MRPSTGLITRMERWQLVTSVGLAVVAFALLALAVAHNTRYGPLLRESIEATRVARSTHEAMLDQQGGLRAYALTGDDRFLEAYERARETMESLDDEPLPETGELGRLHLDMRLAQSAWTERWVPRALDLGSAGGELDDQEDELLLEGKELFDRYRTTYALLLEELYAERDAAVDGQAEAVTRTTALAVTVAVVTAAFSLWRGRRLRAVVKEALDAVRLRLERVGEGDLEPGPPPSGPAELADVQRGIDDTARELAAARAALRAQGEQLRTQNHQLGQVLRFAREVAGSLNLRYVIRGLCSAASNITGSERVVVWLRRDDEQLLHAFADSSGPAFEPIGLEAVPIGEGPVGRAARFGHLEEGSHGAGQDVLDEGGARPGLLAVPMVVGAEVIGVLEVSFPADAPDRESTMRVLEALATQAATAVGAARIHEHTESMAMTDALTQLPNRRRMETDLAREVGASSRYGRPLGFAMIDVDHFKAYNDALGHQAADVALQTLARILAASVRSTDTVYRYGGEEIAVVMRETDLESAKQLGERLREAVEHHFAAPAQPRPVTISVGVASMPIHATSLPELVGAADQALYEAKRSGRNRTVIAGPEVVGAS